MSFNHLLDFCIFYKLCQIRIIWTVKSGLSTSGVGGAYGLSHSERNLAWHLQKPGSLACFFLPEFFCMISRWSISRLVRKSPRSEPWTGKSSASKMTVSWSQGRVVSDGKDSLLELEAPKFSLSVCLLFPLSGESIANVAPSVSFEKLVRMVGKSDGERGW